MPKSKWTGILNLDVEDRLGKTIARDVYFQGAFKLQRPIYHNNGVIPCYYILNPGGGYLDGDRYQMQIRLRDKAKLTLTTQSATKVYKTPHTQAYQETEIFLGKDSYLEYLPDPLIAYKDARYYQKDIVHMEQGATLLYADIITPGWSPDGHYFSYNTLRLKTEIYMDNKLAVYDHIKLQPDEQPLDVLGFMEEYTHLGTFIVIGEKANDTLIDRLYETIQEQTGDMRAGISQLAIPGFTVRIMAHLTQDIERVISACHHVISEEWYNRTPGFLRKY